ncbi:disease resistance protein-like [Dorcoceras hygrometricum]|uniref:Disease resistance protein-like n=1 Tax=Dorcoceras hygrometricum TaxID=472368 RepID=A0A2Z7AN06_9LAMI|nr:disease resistance protein-like [Dorcoceras hygrometricum]
MAIPHFLNNDNGILTVCQHRPRLLRICACDGQLRMVAMFESLVATGLKGFLGCPAVIHDAALLEFFENGEVRDGLVVSTVNEVSVEISEQLLAETFELPMEVLTDLLEISKDLVFYAKSIVSFSGEPVSISGKKKEMKDMVTPGTRQAKGYAIQISLLLENVPNLELGESSEFPSSKILTEKIVHRYISLNDKFGGEEVVDVPRVKRTPVKRAVSKKIPVVTAAEAESVVKKKRTTKSKPVSSKATLETLPVEAVPLQMIAPTTPAPTEQPPLPKRKSQKRKRRLVLGSEDEIVDSQAVVGGTSVEQEPATAQLETDEEIETIDVGTSVGDPQLETFDAADSRTDAAVDYFVEEPMEELETVVVEQSADEAMSLEDIFLSIPVECPIPSVGVEITKITLGKSIKIPGVNEGGWYKAGIPKIPETNKGKAPIQKRDPVKVDKFFNSFSFKKLPHLKIEEISAKEALILSWAETDSTRVALNRKMYILTKYRELLIRKVLEARKLNFVPDVKTRAVESDVEDKRSGSSYEQKNDSDVRRSLFSYEEKGEAVDNRYED